MKSPVVLLVGILLLTGVSGLSRRGWKRAVNRLFDKLNTAFDNADLGLLGTLFTDDVHRMPPKGDTTIGKEAVMQFYQNNVDKKIWPDTKMELQYIRSTCKDQAVVEHNFTTVTVTNYTVRGKGVLFLQADKKKAQIATTIWNYQ